MHYYTYYHCTKRKDPNCTEKVVEEKNLEGQIANFIKTINIPPGFKDWAVSYFKKTEATELDATRKLLDSQNKACETIEKKLSRLMDMRLNDELSESEFATKKIELLKEKEQMKDSINEMSNNSETWLDRLEKAFNIAEDIEKRFRNGDEKKKKEIVANLGSNLSISNKIFSVQNKILACKKVAPIANRIYRRFEPAQTPINKEKLELAYSSSPMMLRR